MHRNLSAEEMIALCEPSPEQTAEGSKRIYDLFGKEVHPDWLNYGVHEGWYNVTTVNVNSIPSFVVWFHLDAQGGLIINACASICQKPQFSSMIAAVDKIAKNHLAKYIAFNTTRAGLARQVVKFGYKAHSVTFEKFLV